MTSPIKSPVPSPAAKKRGAALVASQSSPSKKIKVNDQSSSSSVKLVSWNVGGINACLKKGFLEKVKSLAADILIIQETKLQQAQEFMPKSIYPFQYQSVCTVKKGYSGTALFSKIKPIKVDYVLGEDEFKSEGRYIVAEFEEYFLVAAYVPNAGQKLERLEVKRTHYKKVILPYLEGLAAKKALIFAGDLNVAHQEIDLARPKTNGKTAGFTPGEREDFTHLLQTVGLYDSYRILHPKVTDKYTYYSYRFDCYKKNLGWR